MKATIFHNALVTNLGVAALLLGLLAGGSALAQPEADVEVLHASEAAAPPTWQEAIKMFAAALTLGMAAFATAMTQARIGAAGVGALAENPKLFGNLLIFLVVPETIVILGFVIAALMVF